MSGWLRTHLRQILVLLLSVSASSGCETKDVEEQLPGATAGVGGAPADSMMASVVTTADASSVGSTGAGGCTASCTQNDLTLSFGGRVITLSRAQYGLTSPVHAPSQAWEIYLEAHDGGSPRCPNIDSPTPRQTIIVAGLPAAWPTRTLTDQDGLKLTLLDFEGTLLDGVPLSKAQSVRVTPTMADICTECVGRGGDGDGYVALAVEATFAEGTLQGHAYATHCASLDQP